MSYDLHLIRSIPGQDPREMACGGLDRSDESKEIDPAKEAQKQKVANALIAHNPRLEIFQMDYDEIAKHEGISAEEARRRFRRLELNGPESDSTGIQISLYDDEAAVTVPFWHMGARAGAVFREIQGYLQIIADETGFVIFDPQLERIITADEIHGDSLRIYTNTVESIRGTSESVRRPWWRFW